MDNSIGKVFPSRRRAFVTRPIPMILASPGVGGSSRDTRRVSPGQETASISTHSRRLPRPHIAEHFFRGSAERQNGARLVDHNHRIGDSRKDQRRCASLVSVAASALTGVPPHTASNNHSRTSAAHLNRRADTVNGDCLPSELTSTCCAGRGTARYIEEPVRLALETHAPNDRPRATSWPRRPARSTIRDEPCPVGGRDERLLVDAAVIIYRCSDKEATAHRAVRKVRSTRPSSSRIVFHFMDLVCRAFPAPPIGMLLRHLRVMRKAAGRKAS